MSENEQVNGAQVTAKLAVPTLTGELHIVSPGTSDLTGWVITMAGPAHPKTLAYNDKSSRETLHKDAQIEQSRVNGRKYKAEEPTPEENRRKFAESLVARMVTWTPVDFGWGEIHFNEIAAIETLMRPEVGVYVPQIVDYLLAEKAFMKGSAKT